jgi:hypothetical protein
MQKAIPIGFRCRWRRKGISRSGKLKNPGKPPASKLAVFCFLESKMKKLQIVTTEPDMAYNTDDLRIREIKELSPPSHLMREFPCTDKAAETTFRAREAMQPRSMPGAWLHCARSCLPISRS